MNKSSKSKRRGRRQAAKSFQISSKNLLDLDRQSANLQRQGSDSLTWNVNNGSIPRFGNVQKFDNRVHNIIQTQDLGNLLISSSSLPTFGSLAITAGTHVSQFSQFASVFDQYRIAEVELWLQPTLPASTPSPGNVNLFSVVDYDDANVPSSIAQLLEYENAIVSSISNGHYRKFKPHLAVAAYAGTFTGFSNKAADWIDCASSTVQHYGSKFGMDTSSVTVGVRAMIRIWIQFRNVF
jgi:hypothetical protein